MALRALFFEDFAMAEKRAAQEEVKEWMETTDNRNIDRKDA